MASIFGDSFDHYATAEFLQKWTTMGGTVTIAAALNGNGARWQTGSTPCALAKTGLTTSGNRMVCGFAFKMGGNSTANHAIVSVASGATTLCTLVVVGTSGALAVYRGASANLLGTSTATLPTNSFVYIEFLVDLASGATGAYEVRVSGVNVLSGASVQTSPSATTWDAFRFGTTTSSASAVVMQFDDFYLYDGSGSTCNTFAGPIQMKAIYPDGAGNYSQMTPTAGSNYQCVDEASTNGDTDYVSETTAGEIDTYTFGAVGLTGAVRFVQTNLMVRSDGAGAETVAPLWRIGGTDYAGTAQAISTSYADKTQTYDVSPATSTTWTVSEIDGAEFGPKMVS